MIGHNDKDHIATIERIRIWNRFGTEEVAMTKVVDNIVMEGNRGKLGNLVFRLMPNGEIWVSKN